jgi:hypothetical protein
MMHELWRTGLARDYAPTAADVFLLARDAMDGRERDEITSEAMVASVTQRKG